MAKVVYEVTIKRLRAEWYEVKYAWEVAVYDNFNNQNQNYELRGYGLTFTENGARKIALKHVERIQKGLAKNIKYGIIYSDTGTYENVKRALE